VSRIKEAAVTARAEDGVEAPLLGRRVLEVSTRASGAYCGRLLHLLGASVTRVSLPTTADCPPELVADFEASVHSGKSHVSPDEAPALKSLLDGTHVVVVDSRHDDALDGLAVQLTRDLLRGLRKGCALVDISGHRDPGYAGGNGSGAAGAPPATPLTESALTAMSWSLGHPRQAPLTLPADLPDYLAGTEAAGATALALLIQALAPEQEQEWDIAATDVLASYVGQICANFLPYERPWRRDGARASMSGGSYPAAMFPCRDGHVSIMCRTPKDWQGLLRAMGNPEWSVAERFRDARVVARFHADEADPHLLAWTRAQTRDEVFALGKEHGFPVAPVLTMSESLELEQFAFRDFLPKEDGSLAVPGAPWKLSGAASAERQPLREVTEASRWPAGPVSLAAPLAGLRVLDLSWVWSGPMVTAALRDLGAEILKVEHRGRADPARLRGAALRDGVAVEGPELEVTPYFNQMNHGKRSVAIDISTEAGANLILDLAAECDVVVENMRPGALERRGLDYDRLAERNPGLVVLSMSLMGQTGPMSELGGYAPVMSGLAGLDSLVGYSADDLIGLYNPALGDPNGAAHALTVLLAALVGRRKTGLGAWIDIAQVEAMVSIQRVAVAEAQRRGTNDVGGNGHAVWWPHGTWLCAGDDDWLSVAVRTDAERLRLTTILGLTEVPAMADLDAALSHWALHRPAEEAADILLKVGIPAAPVLSFEKLADSEWARDRTVAAVVEHPFLGKQAIFSLPWKCSGAAYPATEPAPLLGADTNAVLSEVLGLDAVDLAALRMRKAIE